MTTDQARSLAHVIATISALHADQQATQLSHPLPTRYDDFIDSLTPLIFRLLCASKHVTDPTNTEDSPPPF